MEMDLLQTLGLALGAGFSSGLNLYATIALYAIEFLADKIPYVDSVWDVIHTLIRPPAAALLAYGATVAAPPEWRWGAALLAGGVALTSHGTKASARAAANTSPEPFSNWILSLGEDALAVWLTWMATVHPTATIVVVALLMVLAAFLLFHLFRFLRRALQRLFA